MNYVSVSLIQLIRDWKFSKVEKIEKQLKKSIKSTKWPSLRHSNRIHRSGFIVAFYCVAFPALYKTLHYHDLLFSKVNTLQKVHTQEVALDVDLHRSDGTEMFLQPFLWIFHSLKVFFVLIRCCHCCTVLRDVYRVI